MALNHTKSLQELFEYFPVDLNPPENLPSIPITGIQADSRLIKPGNLFVALAGLHSDGHTYISHAVERGAAAVVGMHAQIPCPVPYLLVKDTRPALAHLAAAFYNYPARKMCIIGVTGTDGKTTTCNLIYRILLAAGYKSGVITSVNAVIGDEVLDTGFHVTTPESLDVQRYLHQMVSNGLTHAVLESTSHGLDQDRVTACEFDIAVYTNITHEHLDYHKTFINYRQAKARLLRELSLTFPKQAGNPRLAVLNRDDDSYDFLHSVNTQNEASYGICKDADIKAEKYWQDPERLHIQLHTTKGRLRLDSALLGDFNVYNILAAYTAAVVGLGISAEVACEGIASLEAVSGRMEKISLGQNFLAFVDFAHTPNALLNALRTAKSLSNGKVIAVFGSAGLRDRQKRRLMAENSIVNADSTILTAEDPRTESLDEILAEMADAAISKGGVEGNNFWRIPDRGEAIRFALSLAQPGDVVIACGKGHEQSMCFGEIEYYWDDRVAMRAGLAELLGISGPIAPVLPTALK